MRVVSAKRILLLAAAAASLAWGQPPTITSLSPNSSIAGAATLTMTVNGTNFVAPVYYQEATIPGSQVQWTGGNVVTPLATTFVSSYQLAAVVPSALLAAAGTAAVTVAQASNAPSNALPFNVIVPAPVISAISPPSAPAGSNALALTVTGANFVGYPAQNAQSIVSLNGVALASVFVNSGMLTATVPANLLSSPGQCTVQVTNPGGAASNTATFSVLAPAISSLSSTSISAGSAAFALTVTGANYLSGSQVSFNGAALAATFVNSTTLTTTVPANLVTTPGVVNIQVVNPGGSLSNVVTFTVTAALSLGSISPTSVPVGAAACNLTVTGASFASGSQVSLNSTALATTFISSNSLTAIVPASLVSITGQFNVQVVNPGAAASNALPFSVVSPAIGSLSPSSVSSGVAAFNLAVSGVNFVSGSQVSLDGSALATSFASSTLLNAAVPAALVAGPKVASIVVTNPGVSGNVSLGAPFTVIATLAIATTSLPGGTSGSTYSVTLAGRGGTPPYTWTASGNPPGLAINPAPGFHRSLEQPALRHRGRGLCGLCLRQRRHQPLHLLPGKRKPAGRSRSLLYWNGVGHTENARPVFLLGGGHRLRRRHRFGGLWHHHTAGAAEHHRRTHYPGLHRRPDRHHLHSHGRSGPVPLHAQRQPAAWHHLRQLCPLRHSHHRGRLHFPRHNCRQHRRHR